MIHSNTFDDLLESNLKTAIGDFHCPDSASEGPCDADWELVGVGRGRRIGQGNDLGLSSVPRGPTLARDNLEQMLDTAFIYTRKVQFFDMSWELQGTVDSKTFARAYHPRGSM